MSPLLATLLVCASVSRTAVTPLNEYPLNPSEVRTLTQCETDLECELAFADACARRGHVNRPGRATYIEGWLQTYPQGVRQ